MSLANTNETSEWPESWRTLSHAIRTGRYTDPQFTKLEYEKLWYQTWQFAARLDEIPNKGDYTTYDIGKQSAMLVRVGEDTVKAYYNACPHRGTTLSEGCGHFEKDQIMCPFHGWKWDLEGQNKFIMEQQEFKDGNLLASDVKLREVHCEVFAGFVFISFAKEPQSFEEYIAPVAKYIEGLGLSDMHHYWWRRMEGPANWKVAQEAFFETYHVPATHPQLDPVGAKVVYEDVHTPGAPLQHEHVIYEGLEGGHGRFYAGEKPMSSTDANAGEERLEFMIEHMQHLVHEMDAMVLQGDVDVATSLRGKPLPEGSSYGAEFIKAIYAKAAAEERPMPAPTPENAAMWGGEVFVFPNLLILPNLGNVMIYRIRPNGDSPDSCIFEIFSTTTYPKLAEIPRAEVQHVTDYNDPEQLLLIPRQDFANVPRIQRGLHSNGYRQIYLAKHHEVMILNMHQELDRYLGAPEAIAK
ncbi:Rieske 2Fe-2S domain-containing protein [Aestuariicella hydrocarbonica]|uniref:Rieske 2Fe-2S domain-containing protein n=1 Tax=Pseudomaricurvus hydrocarbonicus TaxID=1470433 RepID=A0A9E5MQG2_9GAMM|nr:SRPBCC family protein [Aestuariicella hydrocarbonica]NHO68540.1 Rieske 2Fe-2S domain-containing protein [Aestuariicella hydrocarbonica]